MLYEKVGGQAAVAKLVEAFYDRVLADPLINGFFEQVDMEAQRRHQTAFIAFALGGPEYTGRSMAQAHAGMNLQPEHFGAVAGHLVAVMQEAGLEHADINEVVARVSTLKDAILYK